MPTTYNGIGTHYYGKQNHSVRTGPCHSCGRVVNLESYNTRLWFVIIFIPVIPLGRKRIIDKCPACTRHMAADADSFEQARQLQTSGSLEQFRREPTPANALQAHAQLLSFHEHEQAAEFRQSALARYPDDAELRAGLANHLTQVSRFDEAAALYQEAFELQPDLPEARIGVAKRKMAYGELDEARELLGFLEEPGAGQHYPLGPIDALSSYYQRQGRHEEALAIAEHLLREIPEAGYQNKFREFVRRSERALGRKESILPPVRHSLRGLFYSEGSPYPPWARKLVLGGGAVVLLVGGLLINNEYIRNHRWIHVVNATGQAVQVSVDGGPPQSVSGLGHVVVAEGHHRLQLSGPLTETREIDLRSDFFQRWSHKPLWVLNPGGEAVLQFLNLEYAKIPRAPVQSLLVGKPIVEYPHVDYPFTDPPHQIQVKGHNTVVEKTAIRWIQGEDASAFLEGSKVDRSAALDFAEHRLRRTPAGGELLLYYAGGARPEERARMEAFLKSGLDRRPLQIQWHRAYQSIAELNGHQAEILPLYDSLLAADPKNGDLLYLRGRIDPEYETQETYYRRAVEASPASGWAWMALGRRAADAARWDESLAALKRAEELKVPDEQLRETRFTAKLGNGEFDDLLKDLRPRVAANPMEPAGLMFLCETLAASGHADQIASEVASWENRLPVELRPQFVPPVRALTAYCAGDIEECTRRCQGSDLLRSSPVYVHSLLAEGKADEAARIGSDGAWQDAWTILAVSLGFSLEGKTDEATRWRDRACEKLETLMPEMRKAARLIRSDEPKGLDELTRLIIDPDDKALLFAWLGRRFPDHRDEYLAAASRYNVRRTKPYLLVRRALDDSKPAKP